VLSGNLSREALSALYGYDWHDEIEKRAAEQDKLIELDIPEFSPQPHSQNPVLGSGDSKTDVETDKTAKKE